MNPVVITGANRGIGLELVRQYLAQSRPVIACCREPAGADQLHALSAGDGLLTTQPLDLSEPDSVRELKRDLAGQPLDILINNAGMAGPFLDQEPTDDLDCEAWLETFRVNTIAPLQVLRQLRANLTAGNSPKAVTVTSQMGAIAFEMPNTMVAYCASKAAINKTMHMLADEFKSDGIATQLIHPGWVKTDMGGADADIDAATSAAGIVQVIESLDLENSGRFSQWNGQPHAW